MTTDSVRPLEWYDFEYYAVYRGPNGESDRSQSAGPFESADDAGGWVYRTMRHKAPCKKCPHTLGQHKMHAHDSGYCKMRDAEGRWCPCARGLSGPYPVRYLIMRRLKGSHNRFQVIQRIWWRKGRVLSKEVP